MTLRRTVARSIPTRPADWRGVVRVAARSLGSARGAIVALVGGVLYLSLFVLPGNVGAMRRILTSSLPLGRKVTALAGYLPPFSPLYAPIDAALVLILALLVGVNLAVFAHLAGRSGRAGTGGATGVGVVGGVLGAGCGVCGSALAPVVGVSVSTSVLPFGGTVLSIASVVLLVLVLSLAAGSCTCADGELARP